MDVTDFDYELPEELIAQEAVEPRDHARLMVIPNDGGEFRHRQFRDLGEELRPGDLLIVNNTRVRAARLFGRRCVGGGRVELLLLERDGARARALLKARRKLPLGDRLALDDCDVRVRVTRALGDGQFELELEAPGGNLDCELERGGRVPLPPYIRRTPHDDRHAADRSRYQTAFAKRLGAVAAPTAGLHFTPELLERLGAAGVRMTEVTLHVGLGTFAPIRVDRIEEHSMHAEWGELDRTALANIRATREAGGRVICVGTTSLRVLESAYRESGFERTWSGQTDLYLHPGNPPRSMDGLITNFHVPRSSLLVLVASIAGRERVLAAYREAIRCGYRLFSYGDATLMV